MNSPHRIIATDLDEIAARAAEDLPYFDGKRVLVTGGAGFLLSYLVDTLAARARERRIRGLTGPSVVVADSFRTGSTSRLAHLASNEDVTLHEVDITRPASFGALGSSFDVVVHGASIASPPTYRELPIETIEANAIGTLALLRAYAGDALDRFVLLSSSEVYGDPDPAFVPTKETYEGRVSFTGPRACYDESKRLAETIAVTFHRTRGTKVRIVRPFNVYGPGMKLDDGRVVPSLARDALANRDLVLHSDGRPTRSFCYVTDFVASLLCVVVRGADGEPYNVGDDRLELPMRSLAETIRRVSGTSGGVLVRRSEDRDYLTDNPHRRCPDLAKLHALGGPRASVALEDGIGRYLAWARDVSLPESRS